MAAGRRDTAAAQSQSSQSSQGSTSCFDPVSMKVFCLQPTKANVVLLLQRSGGSPRPRLAPESQQSARDPDWPRPSPAAIFVARKKEKNTFIGRWSRNLANPVENLPD